MRTTYSLLRVTDTYPVRWFVAGSGTREPFGCPGAVGRVTVECAPRNDRRGLSDGPAPRPDGCWPATSSGSTRGRCGKRWTRPCLLAFLIGCRLAERLASTMV